MEAALAPYFSLVGPFHHLVTSACPEMIETLPETERKGALRTPAPTLLQAGMSAELHSGGVGGADCCAQAFNNVLHVTHMRESAENGILAKVSPLLHAT